MKNAPITTQRIITKAELEASGAVVTQAQRRLRLYVVLRIQDYRLSALAPVDPEDPGGEQDYQTLGACTTISENREGMYQLGRNHEGLLVQADSLPSAEQYSGFARAVRDMQDKLGVQAKAAPRALRLDSIQPAAAGAGAGRTQPAAGAPEDTDPGPF